MSVYLPGMVDHQGKRQWRGEVRVLTGGKIRLVARVYGDTLEAMRDIKWHLVNTLEQRERSRDRDLRNFIRVADR